MCMGVGAQEREKLPWRSKHLLFCCLKPIHRFILGSQDCLRGREGRHYHTSCCSGTMGGNTDLETSMEGGFVARECEQDGAGGAGVHTIAGPAFSLPISRSQQPSERLRLAYSPGVSGIPPLLNQSALTLSASKFLQGQGTPLVWQRAVSYQLQNMHEELLCPLWLPGRDKRPRFFSSSCLWFAPHLGETLICLFPHLPLGGNVTQMPA